MAQTSISPAALYLAIEAARANMKSAEDADDPHEACRHLDLIEAFTRAAARIRANTPTDQAAHRQLASRVADDLMNHASGIRPLCDRAMWRVIEDLQALRERLDKQDEPAKAA